jgi:hypothetical protein
MDAFESPAKFTHNVDECKSHIIPRVIFWPKQWKSFSAPKTIAWSWTTIPFNKSGVNRIPIRKHGLYCFIINPGIANHPQSHLMLYVGKADKMTIRERFKSYFQDMKKVKRPAICYYLNKYIGYLDFCFTPINKVSDINKGEQSLISALIPPANNSFPATVSKIIRGLR